MKRRMIVILGWCFAVATTVWSAPPARHAVVFADAGAAAGFSQAAAGIKGHTAAWGDIDGDGHPDVYVGGYCQPGSVSNMLLRNTGGRFLVDGQPAVRLVSMTSGAVFGDFDNDGDLDLYVSNNMHAGSEKRGATTLACALFRNDGRGAFTDVTASAGLPRNGFKGRGAALVDFDGDGLLDLATCEEYYGEPAVQGIALYRNKGGLTFEDVTSTAGLPTGAPTSSVIPGDLNNDGWPDLFIVDSRGGLRLFLNDRHGRFSEAPGTAAVFAWKVPPGDSDYPAGAALGDVNGDGWLDILVGQHFKQPWKDPVPVRLYLNKGGKENRPAFEEITEAAGLVSLPMKAPHVEIQDFNNDGLPDLYASMVMFADGRPFPLVYLNLGVRDGIPRFREDVLAVNDFPNDGDRTAGRPATVFDRLVKDGRAIYMAAGPSCDYDRDGRLDLAMPSWWPELPSRLLHNETSGGNWLTVRVKGGGGLNAMGIGCRVNVYAAGRLGDPAARIGCREIAAGYGYCSGQEALAHFGLGTSATVDVEIILPHGGRRFERKGVSAGQWLEVAAGGL